MLSFLSLLFIPLYFALTGVAAMEVGGDQPQPLPQPQSIRLAVNVGLESRVESEVNPDYWEGKFLGQIQGQLCRWPWVWSLEAGYDEKKSGQGALEINYASYQVSTWGRYGVLQNAWLPPFVSAGLGGRFEEITSRYYSTEDKRTAVRGLMGAGFGVSRVWRRHWLTEIESRLLLVENAADPAYATIARIGFVF